MRPKRHGAVVEADVLRRQVERFTRSAPGQEQASGAITWVLAAVRLLQRGRLCRKGGIVTCRLMSPQRQPPHRVLTCTWKRQVMFRTVTAISALPTLRATIQASL